MTILIDQINSSKATGQFKCCLVEPTVPQLEGESLSQLSDIFTRAFRFGG